MDLAIAIDGTARKLGLLNLAHNHGVLRDSSRIGLFKPSVIATVVHS